MLDHAEARRIIDQFTWWANPGSFTWLTASEAHAVHDYLEFYEQPYWRVIQAGGPAGFSMFVHEKIELEEYTALGVDPRRDVEQVICWNYTHARALLAEHRFLQVLARLQGWRLSLRELVEGNPHGDPPGRSYSGDWGVLVMNIPPRLLSKNDYSRTVQGLEAAREFYDRLGFTRVQ